MYAMSSISHAVGWYSTWKGSSFLALSSIVSPALDPGRDKQSDLLHGSKRVHVQDCVHVCICIIALACEVARFCVKKRVSRTTGHMVSL